MAVHGTQFHRLGMQKYGGITNRRSANWSVRGGRFMGYIAGPRVNVTNYYWGNNDYGMYGGMPMYNYKPSWGQILLGTLATALNSFLNAFGMTSKIPKEPPKAEPSKEPVPETSKEPEPETSTEPVTTLSAPETETPNYITNVEKIPGTKTADVNIKCRKLNNDEIRTKGLDNGKGTWYEAIPMSKFYEAWTPEIVDPTKRKDFIKYLQDTVLKGNALTAGDHKIPATVEFDGTTYTFNEEWYKEQNPVAYYIPNGNGSGIRNSNPNAEGTADSWKADVTVKNGKTEKEYTSTGTSRTEAIEGVLGTLPAEQQEGARAKFDESET